MKSNKYVNHRTFYLIILNYHNLVAENRKWVQCADILAELQCAEAVRKEGICRQVYKLNEHLAILVNAADSDQPERKIWIYLYFNQETYIY